MSHLPCMASRVNHPTVSVLKFKEKKGLIARMWIRPLFVCLTVFFLGARVYGAVETVQTGIASPRTEAERNDIEQLRQRAIRNAMDLAVVQVSGATLSGERGGTLRTREETVYQDEAVSERTRLENRFSSTATSRTLGHARLVEIIEEHREGENYYVTARISVETESETAARLDAGDYWRRAGSPSISLTLTQEVDGVQAADQEERTLRFFRDNLARNHLPVQEHPEAEYKVMIHQKLAGRDVAQFGTVTMHCRLSYRIVDGIRDVTVMEHRAAHGPDAGFTSEQAAEKCLGAVAPQVAEALVRGIAEIMEDRWNNGVEQQVILEAIPGDLVTRAAEITRNLFRVTGSTPASFNNGRFSQSVRFKGTETELAQALREAFADENWKVEIRTVERGRVRLDWVGETDG